MFTTEIASLVAQYGCLAVFFIVMFESAGLPLPGETALLLAAGYSGATGQLSLSLVIGSAAAGAILGDNLGFWAGRRWGADLLRRHGRFILVDDEKLRLGQYLFQRHGGKIVFFGRFIALLRVLAALLAGMNKFGWRPFLFYNAAGGILWASVMGLGSYAFGESLHRVSGPLGFLALAGIIAGVAAFMIFVRGAEKRIAQQFANASDGKIAEKP